MTMYARIKGRSLLEYPLTEQQVKEAFPNCSFAIPFEAPAGYVLVTVAEQPEFDRIHEKIEAAQPKITGGVWTQGWDLVPLAEVDAMNNVIEAWVEVADKRDAVLASSDWTQLEDAPVDKKAWAVYRQALRDLTEQMHAGVSPANVDWPQPPAS